MIFYKCLKDKAMNIERNQYSYLSPKNNKQKGTILDANTRMVPFIYAFGFSQFERGIRAKTTKPPAMRVVSKNVIQNNHHSFYNEGVQAIKIRKNGDYNG